MRPGRREGLGTQAICRSGPTANRRLCARAHLKHAVHVCDARRVDTQRLVERRRALRCRKEGILSGVRPARRCRAAERRRRKRYMQGKGPTGDRVHGTLGAHPKHVAHVCDA